MESEHTINWRKRISHVPQDLYLADKTILENIAYGKSIEKIEYEKAVEAAKRAKINGLIESMPQGYMSRIGERGIRLSGGQKQRIGIARALYKKSEVIVLDESTSALDGQTEEEGMKTIEKIDSSVTLIVVAHRLQTLKKMDRIIKLDKGKIVWEGKPEELGI